MRKTYGEGTTGGKPTLILSTLPEPKDSEHYALAKQMAEAILVHFVPE